ncbi:hypothetical protein AWZ03_005082 [Drosophila navojoa]|uniref:Uncharacterized protein n=1 Tax=Drosophila navojoa TaxID=7232 RepID=A0A484BIH7_DRONA|nr:hypothetical protein AWZ03_005082 [Drosophila navojoa]
MQTNFAEPQRKLKPQRATKTQRKTTRNRTARGGAGERDEQDATLQGAVAKVSECLFYSRHGVGFACLCLSPFPDPGNKPPNALLLLLCPHPSDHRPPTTDPAIGRLLLKNYYAEWQQKLPMQTMPHPPSPSPPPRND